MQNEQFINDLIDRNLSWKKNYYEADRDYYCETINNDVRIVCDFTSLFGFFKNLEIRMYDKKLRGSTFICIKDKKLYNKLLDHVKSSCSNRDSRVKQSIIKSLLAKKTD